VFSLSEDLCSAQWGWTTSGYVPLPLHCLLREKLKSKVLAWDDMVVSLQSYQTSRVRG
jgi:hypothetical protein